MNWRRISHLRLPPPDPNRPREESLVDNWRDNEKAAVHSTVAVFIVERIRPEQRRLVGKPHLAGGRESVEAGDRRRHSARPCGQRTRPASETEKRLDDGRVLQKASVEGRRCGHRADRQLSLCSGVPRISRLDFVTTG